MAVQAATSGGRAPCGDVGHAGAAGMGRPHPAGSRAGRRAASALRWAAAALALGLAAGCQSSLDTAPLASFDLTGVWRLNAAASDAPPDPREIRRLEDRDIVRGRQRDPEASSAFVGEDFPVVKARSMTIEQDSHSMGILYDDQGPYRDVSWGERERDHWLVQAGWRDGALVIRSRRDLTEGVETMRLEPGGQRLRVEVVVRTGGRDVRTLRVFDRRPRGAGPVSSP